MFCRRCVTADNTSLSSSHTCEFERLTSADSQCHRHQSCTDCLNYSSPLVTCPTLCLSVCLSVCLVVELRRPKLYLAIVILNCRKVVAVLSENAPWNVSLLRQCIGRNAGHCMAACMREWIVKRTQLAVGVCGPHVRCASGCVDDMSGVPVGVWMTCQVCQWVFRWHVRCASGCVDDISGVPVGVWTTCQVC